VTEIRCPRCNHKQAQLEDTGCVVAAHGGKSKRGGMASVTWLPGEAIRLRHCGELKVYQSNGLSIRREKF